MKTLVTPRLFLDLLEERDAENILAMRSDPTVNQFLDRIPMKTMEEAMAFIEKIKNGYASGNTFYWVIRNEKNGPLIGTICLWNFSADHSSAELGYEMRPAFHGNGYMTEAIEKLIDFAFADLRLKKLAAWTHRDNDASMRLLKKNKFAGPFDPPEKESKNDLFFTLERSL